MAISISNVSDRRREMLFFCYTVELNFRTLLGNVRSPDEARRHLSACSQLYHQSSFIRTIFMLLFFLANGEII